MPGEGKSDGRVCGGEPAGILRVGNAKGLVEGKGPRADNGGIFDPTTPASLGAPASGLYGDPH